MDNREKAQAALNISEDLLNQLTEGLSTQEDLYGPDGLIRNLQKAIIEKMLQKELDHHLNPEHNPESGRSAGNCRNGRGKKVLKSESGELAISTPRDRQGTFEPLLVPKRQRRIGILNDTVMALYSKGMSTRDIQDTIQSLYGVEVSLTLVSEITEGVVEEVREWQDRPLEKLYPIVWLDALAVKVRRDARVISMNVYLALGVNLQGRKELLGMWRAETEGAKFWAQILTELNSRGLRDVFVFCVDGLKGFPEAIRGVYPQADIQLCIVHMVRNLLHVVPEKDRKTVASDLKKIYQASSEKSAEERLEEFFEKWDEKYPTISRMWLRHWENLITIFKYPCEIRKVIYTTNAIESLNMVIRKGIKGRRIFPSEDSALKSVWLAALQAARKWTMPIQNWKPALNFFLIQFEERIEVVA